MRVRVRLLNFDDGRPFCLFGLRLYNWESLGDIQHFEPRGCIGWYGCPHPVEATVGSPLEIPIKNLSPLDPFEDPGPDS